MTTVTLHPIGPSAFDALMAKLDAAERRDARVETRLVRLMAANGLNEQGDPLRKQVRRQLTDGALKYRIAPLVEAFK